MTLIRGPSDEQGEREGALGWVIRDVPYYATICSVR